MPLELDDHWKIKNANSSTIINTLEIQIPKHLNAKDILFALLHAYKDAPYLGALWTANANLTDSDPSSPPVSEHFPEAYHTTDWIFGVGITCDDVDSEPYTQHRAFNFESFELMHQARPAFRMGYFAYDMKEQSMDQASNLPPAIGDPNYAFWFRPSLLLIYKKNKITIKIDLHQQYNQLQQIIINTSKEKKYKENSIDPQIHSTDLISVTLGSIMHCTTEFEEYSQKIQEIRREIKKGNFYELNYCIEWNGKYKITSPVDLWKGMAEKSGAPFSAFIKNKEFYTLCNSPERFLRINGNQMMSQPIKGTAPRSNDIVLDRQILEAMQNNPKDQAEHIMIVDLVRNDLTQCSEPLSVNVSELCIAYSFKTVHQLISTIKSQKDKEHSIASILNACFPMGSMTGAPKGMVCKWIDRLEKKRRGVYSGSIGYVDENGNLDLNVIIRTLLYDDLNHQLSLSTGGAITWDSDPQSEWEECQNKAKAILQTEVSA